MPNSEEFRAAIEELKAYRKRSLLILYTLCAFTFAFGVSSVYLLDQNSERVDDIESSRATVIFNNCSEQNARNRAAVTEYDRRILAAKKSGLLTKEQESRLKESRTFTVALIGALQPFQDCRGLVARRLGAKSVRLIR
jgi:hypothetical protein